MLDWNPFVGETRESWREFLNRFSRRLYERGFVIYVPDEVLTPYQQGEVLLAETGVGQSPITQYRRLEERLRRIVEGLKVVGALPSRSDLGPSSVFERNSRFLPRLVTDFCSNEWNRISYDTGIERGGKFISLHHNGVAEVEKVDLVFRRKRELLPGTKPLPSPSRKLRRRRKEREIDAEYPLGALVLCKRLFSPLEANYVRRRVEDHLRKADPVVVVRTAAWLKVL